MKNFIIYIGLGLVMFFVVPADLSASEHSSQTTSKLKTPRDSSTSKKEKKFNKELFKINKEKQKLRRLKNKVERREAYLVRKENKLYQKINKERMKQGKKDLLVPSQDQQR
ncbi:hypothetical protein RCC89_15830 [Cytophagaceae bacterium ABcell3]|nr:hypothetical protein RCC89_15830 [Cytophagaceae bacterium ABcell3]